MTSEVGKGSDEYGTQGSGVIDGRTGVAGGSAGSGSGIRSRVSVYALVTDGAGAGDGDGGKAPGGDGAGAPDGDADASSGDAGSPGRILLTRLSDASPIFTPGLWHLPGGGIDAGEQPVEALARELDEETGLTLLDARLLAAHSYTATRLGVSWHLVALFYAVEVAPGPARVTEADGSTAEVAWHTLAGLREETVRLRTLSPAAVDGLRLLDG